MAGRFEGLTDIQWEMLKTVVGNRFEARSNGTPSSQYALCTQCNLVDTCNRLKMVRLTQKR